MTRIKELAARGPGYPIFAPAAAYDFAARGALVKSPIVEPVTARPVCLVRNPAQPQSNACRAVVGVMLEVARDLGGAGGAGAIASGCGCRMVILFHGADRPSDPYLEQLRDPAHDQL